VNENRTVAPQLPAPAAAGLKADDVYYIVFRHKWKIIVCGVLGLAAAAGLYVFHPPPFQSEATVFIRYVTDTSGPGVPGSDSKAVSLDRGENIINTEVEILASLDIAEQVADAIGPDKILGNVKGIKNRERAAAQIQANLVVEPRGTTAVIALIYKNHDPTVVQPVLTAIVDAYTKKHAEIHRGMGDVDDSLSRETDQLRSSLSQTEEELRKAKEKAGILSLEDAQKSYAQQIAGIQQQIFSAQAELADRSAMLDEIAKRSPAASRTLKKAAAGTELPIPDEQIDAYRNVMARLDYLQKTEQELLSQFTEQNQRVQEIRAQIVEAQGERRNLEQKYPGLTRISMPAVASGSSPAAAPSGAIDLTGELARLIGLQSRIKILNSQLDEIRAKSASVDQAAGTISELQRQEELEDANYRYYSTHLEASRIDDALNAGRSLNIVEIQTPTPPYIDWQKTYKILGMIAGGGFVFGLAWAFLIETYLDRSIRRPIDVEQGLRVPLFLSIPAFGRKQLDPHVFHETLRDRLIGYFESKNLTHKPKLVAVTGVGRKAGVTTTAAGLAQSLSETGEGNVLLVDMTVSQGSSRQFYKGKAVSGIDQLLNNRDTAQVQDNLYVVGAEPKSDKLSRALPSRFSQLVPQLKASDFDYIIFDMPAVNQISITPRLAGFMDMVLLVVESEQTDRDLARQAAVLLAESRAHVGVVLNKTRNYLPSKAHHDFLGNV
jgi:uncharacterized protein involved in exopolysaccharide biosynthesis/Mrp family chromosome partitioning ATPase